MPLTPSQRSRAEQFLKEFVRDGMNVGNQGEVYPAKRFYADRLAGIPPIAEALTHFLSGKSDLAEFRAASSRLSFKHNQWGFTSFSGQMALNQMDKWTDGSDRMARLLREGLALPSSKADAAERINTFAQELPKCLPGGKPIRLKSLPYFLSYWWQIQAHEKFPVFYVSDRKTIEREGFATFGDDLGVNYRKFWDLYDELAELFSSTVVETGLPRYWLVEHVLWYQAPDDEGDATQKAPQASGKGPERRNASAIDRVSGYVPPVVSDLRKLAIDESAALQFEQSVAVVFRMLGFEVSEMGQGAGRQPDGIAKSREHNYAIMFDAKARKGGFAVGTDDRKAIEYIRSHERELRGQGYQTTYFVYVSGAFTGDNRSAIDRIRKEPGVKSVVLVTADQLLRLLARHVSDPRSFDLDEFRSLFLDSGTLANDRLEEFLEQ